MFPNNMGQRTNRKRIRHRPNRAQRKYGAFASSSFTSSATSLLPPPQPPSYLLPSSKYIPSPLRQSQQQIQPSQSHQHPLPPSAMSIRYSYSSTSPLTRLTSRDRERGLTTASKPFTTMTAYFPPSTARDAGTEEGENALTRDLRVFGGVVGDEMDSSDLRGPMLDVVLGLFNGVDYDDEMC